MLKGIFYPKLANSSVAAGCPQPKKKKILIINFKNNDFNTFKN